MKPSFLLLRGKVLFRDGLIGLVVSVKEMYNNKKELND